MLSFSSRIDIELELRRRALREEANAKYHNNLSVFIKDAWHVVEPLTTYIHGWHIDAMSEHLMAITAGQINRLLINVPPGMMKSLTTNVFWPAWMWSAQTLTHYRYLCAAHQKDLATRDNVKMRRLVMSEWYKNRWGQDVVLVDDQNAKTKFENTAGGWREASAANAMTGSRGDIVMIDDPHNVKGAESKAKRESTNEWFLETVPTRLNNPKKSAIAVIMQRLHSRDVSGVILAKELNYTHLMLPMEFEKSRRCVTSIGWSDPRTEENELLFPEQFPAEVVERDKKVLGEYATAGQLQQRPAPREGGIIKKEWIKIVPRATFPRSYPIIVQSYDTAFKTGQTNDYTVGLTIGFANDSYWVLGRIKGRFEYPELINRIKLNFGFHKPNVVLIEDKASGQSAIQSLKKETSLPIKAIKVDSDKETRVHAISFLFENSKVNFPDEEWVKDYIEVITEFPNGAYDDDVDATSMALTWLYRYTSSSLKQERIDIFSR